MATTKQPTAISAFMLGAMIPKALVGDILEQLYLKGLEGSLQCQPVYDKPASAKKQLADQQALHALPAPSSNGHDTTPEALALRKRPRPAGMSIAEYLYRLIAEKAPIDRTAIGQVAALIGVTSPRVTTELWRMKDNDWVVMNGTVYTLGSVAPAKFRKSPRHKAEPAAAAPPEPTPAPTPAPPVATGKDRKTPGPESQEGILLAYLRKGGARSVSYNAMTQYFKTRGLRPESAGVAVVALKAKGWVKRIAPRTYEYIP